MKKLTTIGVAILIIVSSFATMASRKAEQAQGGPVNKVVVDLTYDPATGNVSVGGLSSSQLRALGMPTINGDVMNTLSRFTSAHLTLNNSGVGIEMEGVPVAYAEWNPLSRQALFNLAESYGLALDDNVRVRAEGWLGAVDFELTIRNTAQVSRPLVVDLDTPISADVARNGRLSVEGFDTGLSFDAETLRIAKAGKISNTTVCWKQGALTSQINGSDLPTVTVYQEGLEVLDKALALGLGNKEPFFQNRAGVNLSFDGTHDPGASCGD